MRLGRPPGQGERPAGSVGLDAGEGVEDEGAVGALLAAGAADGTLRTDVSDDDALLGISGIVQSTSDYGTREQADRLVGLLMDALTHRA